MRKVIVLSINENPIYQFTLPLVVWSWVRIGWTPFVFINAPKNERLDLVKATIINNDNFIFEKFIENIPGYRSDTIAQVSRLYAACCFENTGTYLLSGDSDMMALSDYWKPDTKKITIYGHDLTGFQQMPICYLGMTSQRWREVMGLHDNDIQKLMKRDLDSMPDSGENGNQVDRWCTDQRLITQRINECTFEKDFIHRGVLANGYPLGRIDRSAWATYHPNLVDAHLPHDIHSSDEAFLKVMRMLSSVFQEEDFTWFADYREQFKKIL